MSFSQAKKLEELDKKISILPYTSPKYKEQLNTFLNVILVQFQEFRDQMMSQKRTNGLNPDSCTQQKREITLIGSEIKELVNGEITDKTFSQMKKLFFEAHGVATYYISTIYN